MKIFCFYSSRLTSLGIVILFSLFPGVLLSSEKQGFKVSGSVLSMDDIQLPGVNVVVNGTAHGTVTDLQENFTIKVPDVNSILYFSQVGYRVKESAVNEHQPFRVRLVEDPSSRMVTYSELVEMARQDMKSQIEPDWDVLWDQIEKSVENMRKQLEPDWDMFWDLIEKSRQDMRNQVNP